MGTIRPSGLSPRLSTEFWSSFCHLSTSNAPFMSSTRSFPLKAWSLRASVKHNPKPVTAEMKRMKVEEDSSDFGRVSVFNQYMSNYGFMRSLVLVEIKWFIKLSQIPQVTVVPSFSKKSLSILEGLIDEFDSREDYRYVIKFAHSPSEDAIAAHYFLNSKRSKLLHPDAERALRFSFHACTHDDLIKLAYAFSLKEVINKVMLPIMDDLIRALCKLAKDNADVPMHCRTEKEPAATTLGKEVAIFAARLSNERQRLSKVAIVGDFAGYSGNHNANVVAYPELDWQQIAKEFVEESLGLSLNPYVRVEPYDYLVDLMYAIKRFSVILAEFIGDVQTCTSVGIFNQISEIDEFKPVTTPKEESLLYQINYFCEWRPLFLDDEMSRTTKDGEFGWSSGASMDGIAERPTVHIIKNMGDDLMSHLRSYKVALLGIRKLQVFPFCIQQDDIIINILLTRMTHGISGTTLAALLAGSDVNKTYFRNHLDDWWEMLEEPTKLVLQRYGMANFDYWRMTNRLGISITVGDTEEITEASFKEFISHLEIPDDAKANLLNLTPQKYIGQAASIANNCVDKILHDLGNSANVNTCSA